jgi:hypothetical protein
LSEWPGNPIAFTTARRAIEQLREGARRAAVVNVYDQGRIDRERLTE